jgi:hypothetical protein
MSNTKVEINKEETKGFLRNVTLAYVKVNKAGEEYKGKRNYEVTAIVNEDIADDFEAKVPQSSIKKVKTAEFEAKYKMAPIFPEEKNHYAITIRANSQAVKDIKDKKGNLLVAKGDMIPYDWASRPKAILLKNSKGKSEDITLAEYGIANGSVGDLAFNIGQFESTNYAQLTGLLVRDLIEYEFESSDNPFGIEVETTASTMADEFNTEDEVSGGVDEGDIFDEEEDDGFPA